MNLKNRRQHEKAAFEIVEEAVHLLRMAPVGILASYYIGGLPFILGLLYFWTEMSQSAFAYERCAPAALALALLFIWLKVWHAVFALQLRSQIAAEPLPRWTSRRLVNIAITQSIIQPSGLFLLPISMALLLPFAWTYVFYQNVTAIALTEPVNIRLVLRRAGRQAGLWPQQSHVLLLVLFAFGIFVFMNLTAAIIVLPSLIKMLFGIESYFTLSPASILNSTFLAVSCGLTYLCLNPLLKAVCVLRCFYGEALETGEDLRVELRSLLLTRKLAVGIAVFFVALTGAAGISLSASGRDIPQTGGLQTKLSQAHISTSTLDRSISDVISRPEYAWRFPREIHDEAGDGWLASFMHGVIKPVKYGLETVKGWIRSLRAWWRRLWARRFSDAGGRAGRGFGGWTASQLLLTALIALVACTLALLVLRLWKARRKARRQVLSEAIASKPDLADEDVIADQFPEQSWMNLARELIERGDLRLALRALYLAGLAHLAEREVIRVVRYKSNRDYEAELKRRVRTMPELQAAFSDNVTVFERVWYGRHETTHETLNQFRANLERIRAC